MGYEAVSYDKRIKENIRNYTLSNLYDMEMIKKYFLNLAEMLEINILLTNRHGEKTGYQCGGIRVVRCPG